LVYTLNWIRERTEARFWLEEHWDSEQGKATMVEWRPRIPWSLWVLGEEEADLIMFVMHDDESPTDCEEFGRTTMAVSKLFPESQIIDVHQHDITKAGSKQ
jgi:hypothetical protein